MQTGQKVGAIIKCLLYLEDKSQVVERKEDPGGPVKVRTHRLTVYHAVVKGTLCNIVLLIHLHSPVELLDQSKLPGPS